MANKAVKKPRRMETVSYTHLLMMETIMRWADQAYGIKYVPLRYFNVAGAKPDGSIGEDPVSYTHLFFQYNSFDRLFAEDREYFPIGQSFFPLRLGDQLFDTLAFVNSEGQSLSLIHIYVKDKITSERG